MCNIIKLSAMSEYRRTHATTAAAAAEAAAAAQRYVSVMERLSCPASFNGGDCDWTVRPIFAARQAVHRLRHLVDIGRLKTDIKASTFARSAYQPQAGNTSDGKVQQTIFGEPSIKTRESEIEFSGETLLLRQTLINKEETWQ
jgi:hypothetical protein